jgi:hypothetical protein
MHSTLYEPSLHYGAGGMYPGRLKYNLFFKNLWLVGRKKSIIRTPKDVWTYSSEVFRFTLCLS